MHIHIVKKWFDRKFYYFHLWSELLKESMMQNLKELACLSVPSELDGVELLVVWGIIWYECLRNYMWGIIWLENFEVFGVIDLLCKLVFADKFSSNGVQRQKKVYLMKLWKETSTSLVVHGHLSHQQRKTSSERCWGKMWKSG